jgi:hypothetical protein
MKERVFIAISNTRIRREETSSLEANQPRNSSSGIQLIFHGLTNDPPEPPIAELRVLRKVLRIYVQNAAYSPSFGNYDDSLSPLVSINVIQTGLRPVSLNKCARNGE